MSESTLSPSQDLASESWSRIPDPDQDPLMTKNLNITIEELCQPFILKVHLHLLYRRNQGFLINTITIYIRKYVDSASAGTHMVLF